MSHKSFNPPKGWRSDLLSRFQSTAMENEFATFVHAPEWQGMLCEVATILDSCSSYAMERLLKANDPALLLFVCAQSQYLASVRSTAAGHCIAAYPTGRSAVESALYGWYLANNPTASQNWHNKPEPDQKKALRDWNAEFKVDLRDGIYGIERGGKSIRRAGGNHHRRHRRGNQVRRAYRKIPGD